MFCIIFYSFSVLNATNAVAVKRFLFSTFDLITTFCFCFFQMSYACFVEYNFVSMFVYVIYRVFDVWSVLCLVLAFICLTGRSVRSIWKKIKQCRNEIELDRWVTNWTRLKPFKLQMIVPECVWAFISSYCIVFVLTTTINTVLCFLNPNICLSYSV